MIKRLSERLQIRTSPMYWVLEITNESGEALILEKVIDLDEIVALIKGHVVSTKEEKEAMKGVVELILELNLSAVPCYIDEFDRFCAWHLTYIEKHPAFQNNQK